MSENFDNEISLISLYEMILAIKKRFILILGIVAIAVLATVIGNSITKPIYRISATLIPGWLDRTTDGKVIYVDSSRNIASSIENGGFRLRIIESMKLDFASNIDRLKFLTIQPKGTQVVHVYYDTGNKDEGITIVDELLKQVTEFYGTRVNTKKGKINNTIQIKNNQIAKIVNGKTLTERSKEKIESEKTRLQLSKQKTENSKTKIKNDREKVVAKKEKISNNIELEKKRISLLEEKEKTLEKQFEQVQTNTREIMAEKKNLIRQNSSVNPISLLLYSNTIQQNISYVDRLNSQIGKNKLDQESTKNNIENLKIQFEGIDTDLKNIEVSLSNKNIDLKNIDVNLKDLKIKLKNLDTKLQNYDIEIANTKEKIKNLELDKDLIEGIHILQPALATTNPIKPKKKLNIMLALFVSLAFSVFLAIFLEWQEKNKSFFRTK